MFVFKKKVYIGDKSFQLQLTSYHALFSNLYELQTMMFLNVSLLFLKQLRQEDPASP